MAPNRDGLATGTPVVKRIVDGGNPQKVQHGGRLPMMALLRTEQRARGTNGGPTLSTTCRSGRSRASLTPSPSCGRRRSESSRTGGGTRWPRRRRRLLLGRRRVVARGGGVGPPPWARGMVQTAQKSRIGSSKICHLAGRQFSSSEFDNEIISLFGLMPSLPWTHLNDKTRLKYTLQFSVDQSKSCVSNSVLNAQHKCVYILLTVEAMAAHFQDSTKPTAIIMAQGVRSDKRTVLEDTIDNSD